MTYSSVAAVEVLGLDAVVMAHAECKVSVRGFDQQVVVIPHQAIGVNHPVETADHLAQNSQVLCTIIIAQEYRLLSITP